MNWLLCIFFLASIEAACAYPDKEMVWIKPGSFTMGVQATSFADASPAHEVELDGFWLDKTEVTNHEFARFVEATGYKTIAERVPTKQMLPGVPEDKLVAGSLVFTPPKNAVSKACYLNWWRYVPGACWRHPFGLKSDIKGKDNYPVVQIAFADAQAYAAWAHKRLPTEAEFEYAQRGGLETKYSWGDCLKPKGKWQANLWQGVFPCKNSKEDGFVTSAPVARFNPNGYGLFDMTGNVWEWCSDFYHANYYKQFADSVAKNPKGPETSFDPDEPTVPKRVQKGGSYLCTDEYCTRYILGARGKGEPNSGTSNVGFRCARDSD